MRNVTLGGRGYTRVSRTVDEAGAKGDISLCCSPSCLTLAFHWVLSWRENSLERGGRELGGQAVPVRLHSASETVVPRTWPEPQNPLGPPTDQPVLARAYG